MPSFTHMFTLAALATILVMVDPAAAAADSVAKTHCPGAKVVHETTVDVGNRTVTFTSSSCAAKTVAPRFTWPAPPVCPTNVCGTTCHTTCTALAGVLPPISEDCQTIEDAVVIFQDQMPPTFTIDANHLVTLSFGTCSYFFSNKGTKQLEYCWNTLSTTGAAAGAACFPPVQPFSSAGLCSPPDGSWTVGAAHS